MADSSSERENAVYIAFLAEQAERYEEVVENMKQVAKMGEELTPEERDLLTSGYWKLIVRRRDSWNVLKSLEQEEKLLGNDENVGQIVVYKQKLETEIIDICTEVLSLIDEHLIPSISNPVAYMSYYKMKGDYYRYLGECKIGNDRDEPANEAMKAYEAAMSTAVNVLHRADPFRLGLDLNLSVFHHVILDSPQRACEIAKEAVAEATSELLGELSEEDYETSTKMLDLLKNNIRKWNCDGD